MKRVVGLALALATLAPRPLQAAPARDPDSVSQQYLSLAEMSTYFDDVKKGTPVRLVFRNGSQFAGNFERKDPDQRIIYCRRGLGGLKTVPLESVVEAYLMPTNAEMVRLKRADLNAR
ncbi:MAG: hypothetical protein JO102_00040 [Elusimicrobia bacterium]|nr:hypothetical protein [Elusimicrobiota bacterium]